MDFGQKREASEKPSLATTVAGTRHGTRERRPEYHHCFHGAGRLWAQKSVCVCGTHKYEELTRSKFQTLLETPMETCPLGRFQRPQHRVYSQQHEPVAVKAAGPFFHGRRFHAPIGGRAATR